ncbi:hypothetical protein PC9H_005926 [Pleurotus ostreatus]|uniref:PLAC8-domain-containing protein n=1 Tax=Pleurotus ostreatus TaxID=5322 RepID=A0A8H6ZSW4_PLEOS|nr:uncharacterized protein PC9H_005926 [Pleurotus ostreatus]KAF7430224.1 hypothetical protein PC9H_005926 [Pleurotus ostreatus]
MQQQPHHAQQPQQLFMQQPSPPQQVYVHVGNVDDYNQPVADNDDASFAFFKPQAMPAMVVVPGGGGNRNAKNLPMDSDGREWSHGLCDCCSDVGTCLIATFFPCIVYAQNKRRYEHLNRGQPDPERGGSGFNGDCLMHGCITCCFGIGCVLQIPLRGHLRSRYHIKGGGCGDCMVSWCCTPCGLTQEARELELEEASMGI